MLILFSAVSAIVPSLLLIWFFHSRDVYPEPPRVIWATFGLGVLTVFPILLVALPTAAALGTFQDPYVNGLAEAFLTAALPEEFFKFLVVVVYCMRHREFDEPMDGIVYGAVASLGFATFENVLYVAKGGAGVAVLRALSAVPGHACMGAVMGYYVGQAKFRPTERMRLLFTGFASAVIIHGMYDFPLLTMKSMSAHAGGSVNDHGGEIVGLMALTLVVMIVGAWWALSLARKMRKEQESVFAQRVQSQIQAPAYATAAGGAPGMAYAAAAGGAPGMPYPGAPYAQPNAGAPPYAQPNTGAPYPAPMHGGPAATWGGASPQAAWNPSQAMQNPPAGSNAIGWLFLFLGAIVASGGGLFTLAFAAILSGLAPSDGLDTPALVVGLVIVGVLPLCVGFGLFALGIKRLNQRPPPYAYGAPAAVYAHKPRW